MKRLLRELPTAPLAVAALLLGLAPFVPQPHLVEKAEKLLSGAALRPIDYFDLLFHLAPTILLILKWLVTKGESHS